MFRYIIQKRFKFPQVFPKEYLQRDHDSKAILSLEGVQNMTTDELASVFDLYGRVFDCHIHFLQNGELTNQATVTMDTVGASRAFQSLNNTFIKGFRWKIEMKPIPLKTSSKWIKKEYIQKEISNTKEWKALAKRWHDSTRHREK
jgi:hypothetical protein